MITVLKYDLNNEKSSAEKHTVSLLIKPNVRVLVVRGVCCVFSRQIVQFCNTIK